MIQAIRIEAKYRSTCHVKCESPTKDLFATPFDSVRLLYGLVVEAKAYMSIESAPVKDVIKDMVEMDWGVQYPTRGLF